VKHINKPSNKNTIFEDGQWWYVGTNDGARRSITAHNKKNTSRMFVNGKYVPKSHPLYKSGRYKNFESAAFSALQGYEKSNVGYVYAVCNPAWKGWYKVGMAVDAADRCSGYQTSSPFRDYKVSYSKYFEDRREAERLAHSALKENKIEHANEWFKTDLETIKNVIKNIKDVQHEA
jgi:hypothetical protein